MQGKVDLNGKQGKSGAMSLDPSSHFTLDSNIKIMVCKSTPSCIQSSFSVFCMEIALEMVCKVFNMGVFTAILC